MDKHRHDIEQPHRHEDSDADIRKIVITGGILFGMILLGLLVVGLLVAAFQRTPVNPDRPPSAFAGTPQPPPEPRLQTAPPLDLRELRRREDAILQTYGWVNQGTGAVRMPIDKAIDLLAQRGLPARPESPEAGVPATGPPSGAPLTGSPSQVDQRTGSTQGGPTGQAERISGKDGQR